MRRSIPFLFRASTGPVLSASLTGDGETPMVAPIPEREADGETRSSPLQEEPALRDLLLPHRGGRDRKEPRREPGRARPHRTVHGGPEAGPHPAPGKRRLLGHVVHRLLLPADVHV